MAQDVDGAGSAQDVGAGDAQGVVVDWSGVRAVVDGVFGTRGVVEQTGGGCTALVYTLEGGVHVVLNDEGMSAEGSFTGDLWVGAYLPGAWLEGEAVALDALITYGEEGAAYVTAARLAEVARVAAGALSYPTTGGPWQ